VSSSTKEKAELRKVTRLVVVSRVGCHTGPVTCLCVGFGLLFSVSSDMAVAAWPKPRRRSEDGDGFDASVRSGRVPHAAAVMAVACAHDCLFSADAGGSVIVHAAAQFRESIVPPRSVDVGRSTALLEEEVIEKPSFFSRRSLASLSFRAFLAQVLWHYFPPVPLRRGAGDEQSHNKDLFAVPPRKTWRKAAASNDVLQFAENEDRQNFHNEEDASSSYEDDDEEDSEEGDSMEEYSDDDSLDDVEETDDDEVTDDDESDDDVTDDTSDDGQEEDYSKKSETTISEAHGE